MWESTGLTTLVERSVWCVIFWPIAVIVAGTLCYSLRLLAVAAWGPAGRKGQCRAKKHEHGLVSFLLLVPAHNEEQGIRPGLEALAKIDYPEPLRRIVVIADNCTDSTAAVARSVAGVDVIERFDPGNIGKGHALKWALARVQPADIVCVIDADTIAEPGFLKAMCNAYLSAQAAESSFVAQGRYRVSDSSSNWRASLMEGALALVHHVRPLGRERLGLSVGLKGNGMCFCWDVTKRVAWRGGSLTEDIEYTVDLALDSGIRVRYVPGAIVYAEMPSSQQGAQSQRVRWEAGRRDVLRRLGRRMLTASRTSMIVRDLLIDLILPPMAELAAMIAILVVLTAVAPYVRLSMEISGTVSALAFAALAVYVVGGFRVGGAPRDAYRALVMAPFYIIWKIIVVLLAALARKPLTWVRTARRGEAKPASGAGSTRP